MLGVGEEIAAPPSPPPAPSKRKQLQSNAMKRTSDWIYSQELPSDITVQVGDSAFALHKFPLLSKCEYIRKLLSETNDLNSSLIKILDIPGGVEAFELAAKFCYGINFEISIENISMLRCAAEYLGMTEDYSVGNLVSRTEEYLEEVALVSLSSAATVLHKSEDLLPISEKVKLVSRCIDAIAYLACNDNQFYLSLRTDNDSQESLSSASNTQPRAVVDWWAEELMVLRIDTFQRVLMAMEARGIKQYALGPVFMLYAQKSLRGLMITLNPVESLDLIRTLRMASYGMLVSGPSLHLWFNTVSRFLPKRDILTTFKKMCLGQVVYGPIMTAIFFSINAGLQGETGAEIFARLKRDLIPTLVSGLVYWPMCDFVTFKFTPVRLQPLVSNSFSFLWTIYITYMASLQKASIEDASTDS